jgi:hypothetical protein
MRRENIDVPGRHVTLLHFTKTKTVAVTENVSNNYNHNFKNFEIDE